MVSNATKILGDGLTWGTATVCSFACHAVQKLPHPVVLLVISHESLSSCHKLLNMIPMATRSIYVS